MALGQELKEFVAGFQTGYKMMADAEYDKEKIRIAGVELKLREREAQMKEEMMPLEIEGQKARNALLGVQARGVELDNREQEYIFGEHPEWLEPGYASRDRTDQDVNDVLEAQKGKYGVGAGKDEAAAPSAIPDKTAGVTNPSNGVAVAQANAGGPTLRAEFVSAVRKRGVTNPIALAAVTAYGQRETGYRPELASASWDDLGKPSGGIMSWRDDRLNNMRNHTGGDFSGEAQADFFVNENPQLIAALNNARTPDEANALMARAWRFKGYDDPNNSEFQARLALTRRYAKQFEDFMGGQAIPTDEA